MMKVTHHMSMNLAGCLRNFKGRKIRIFNDENGNILSDTEARAYIAELMDKGHKLMLIGNGECEGFDPFEKGCPGHAHE